MCTGRGVCERGACLSPSEGTATLMAAPEGVELYFKQKPGVWGGVLC